MPCNALSLLRSQRVHTDGLGVGGRECNGGEGGRGGSVVVGLFLNEEVGVETTTGLTAVLSMSIVSSDASRDVDWPNGIVGRWEVW